MALLRHLALPTGLELSFGARPLPGVPDPPLPPAPQREQCPAGQQPPERPADAKKPDA